MPLEAQELLRFSGFEAYSVYDELLQGTDDWQLISACRDEQLTLITCDLDFANIRSYPPEQFNGIVVLRPARQDRQTIMQMISDLIPSFHIRTISGQLWIVSGRGIRIHTA